MSDDIWVRESPKYVLPSEAITFSHEWEGATSLASANATVYLKGGADVTSIIMPAGSHSTSGNIQTLKEMKAWTKGNTYILNIQCTVDGNVEIRKCEFICLDPAAGM